MKSISYISLILLLCSCNNKAPEPEIIDSGIGNISKVLALDSLYKQMERDKKSEFDYYLERHNVADEGYEMVAAFSNGKRHSETIDTITITNIGRWKGKKREGTAITRDSLGRITIGHDSTIGGNIWLTHSVPPNSRILQSKAVDAAFEAGAGI